MQGRLHRGGARIGQLGPGLLIVGPNGGLALRQRQAPAYVAVHVAVGDVMDGLADGPPFRAVRCIELRVVQPAHGVAVEHGGGGDLRDQCGVSVGRHGLLKIELADGITEIHVPILPATGENGDMRWTPLAVLLALPARAAELQPRTVQAFDRYIRQTEQRLADSKIFLWADESASRASRVKAGEVVVDRKSTRLNSRHLVI